ncbi:MAG: hypothetical protein U0M55_08490 [Butyrivibrio sp.]
MKITDRDKKLLCVVGAAIIIFCAYYFGCRILINKTQEITETISALNKEHNALKLMLANAKKYTTDTESYNSKYDEILNKYDSGNTQEYSIMLLKEIEDRTGAWISQAGLAQTEEIYTFGEVTTSNPYAEEGSKVYHSDYVGNKTTLTLTYQATYDQFKDMINYINGYKYKFTIDSISMSYTAETDSVSGSLVLTQYAITGGDRKFNNVNITNVLNGTDNIFHSGIFSGGENLSTENGDNIIVDYDYYFSLQADGSDMDPVVFGPKNDSTGSATVSAAGNEMQDAYVRFFGENGEYYVQYSVGDKKYPAAAYDDGQLMLPGEELSMLVISSKRSGNDDKSGVNATIVNDTDMTLKIKIANEDGGNPRFVLKDYTGDVVVYN